MNKIYTTSICFDVKGDWEHFDEIPYSVFIEGMEDKLNELKTERYYDAFDLVDVVDSSEEE